MKIVFATNNAHKIEEVRKICPKEFTILSLKDVGVFTDIPEDHSTLEENAKQKACFIYERLEQKYAVIADDTGLEVEALDGRPGVYSARYAGELSDSKKNIKKLLFELGNNRNRAALFKTVIYFKSSNKGNSFEGILKGEIAQAPRGNRGFGYDSVFVPSGYELTLAEMTAEQKNVISHRSKALYELKKHFTN